MTFNDYQLACVKFSKDTQDWSALESGKFYTTLGNGWNESCDNADGGIDVSWAFWKNGWDAVQDAREWYQHEYDAMCQLADDDKWDAEQREYIKRTFEDMP